VEFDALYRRLSYTGSGSLAGVFSTTSATGSNWEFPLLLKYRFHFPVVKPYVDAGVAWDTLAGLKQTVTGGAPFLTGSASAVLPELKQNTTMGFVIGGGIDIHAAFLHISPELRFTRWNSAQINDDNGLLHSNLNQAEFLVGFTF
jgi:outer membrane protein W